MERRNFTIALDNGFTYSVPGYVFCFSGCRFGIAKGENRYRIFELTTGKCLVTGDARQTMKSTIDRFIRSVVTLKIMPRIRVTVAAFGKDLNPDIEPKTEYLTCYTLREEASR